MPTPNSGGQDLSPIFEDGSSITPNPEMFTFSPPDAQKEQRQVPPEAAFLCRVESEAGGDYITYVIRGARVDITEVPADGKLVYNTTIIFKDSLTNTPRLHNIFFKGTSEGIKIDTGNISKKVVKTSDSSVEVTIEIPFSALAPVSNYLLPEMLVVLSGFVTSVEVESVSTTLTIVFNRGSGQVVVQPETIVKRGKNEPSGGVCKRDETGEPTWDTNNCKLLSRLGPFKSKKDADDAASQHVLDIIKASPTSEKCELKIKLWCLPVQGGAWYDWYADVARCCDADAISKCTGKPLIPKDCFKVREIGPKKTSQDVLIEIEKILKKTKRLMEQQQQGSDTGAPGMEGSMPPQQPTGGGVAAGGSTWLSLMEELLKETGEFEDSPTGQQGSGDQFFGVPGQEDDKDIKPLEPLPEGCQYCFTQYCTFDADEKQIKYYGIIYKCCLPEGSSECDFAGAGDEREFERNAFYQSICQDKVKEIIANTREEAIAQAEQYIAQALQQNLDATVYYRYPTPWCVITHNDDCSYTKKWKTFVWRCVYNCSCGLGFKLLKPGVKHEIFRSEGKIFLRTTFDAVCVNPKTDCENYDFNIENINISINYDTSYVECKYVGISQHFDKFQDYPYYNDSNIAYDSSSVGENETPAILQNIDEYVDSRFIGSNHCVIKFHLMLDITNYYNDALQRSDGNMHSCMHIRYDVVTDCGGLGKGKVVSVDYSRTFCNNLDSDRSCCGYDEGVPLEHYINKETGLVGQQYLVETLGPVYEVASDDIELSPGMNSGTRETIYNRALERIRELGVPQPGCTYSINIRSYIIYRKQRFGGGRIIEWWADIVKTRTRKRPSVCCAPQPPQLCNLRYTVHSSVTDDGRLVGFSTRYDTLLAAERKIREYLTQPFNYEQAFWRVQLWCNPVYERGECTHRTEWFANIYMCDSLATFIRYPVISGCKQFRFVFPYKTAQEAYDAARTELLRYLRSTRGTPIRNSMEELNQTTIDDNSLPYGYEFEYEVGGERKRCIYTVDIVAMPTFNRRGEVTPTSWGAVINLCCQQDMDTVEDCSCTRPDIWTLHPLGAKIPCTVQFDLGPYHDKSVAEYVAQQFLVWIAGDNFFHQYRVWCNARIYQEDRTLTQWYATVYLCRPTETIPVNEAADYRGNVYVESLIPPRIWTEWPSVPEDVDNPITPRVPDGCDVFMTFGIGVDGANFSLINYLSYVFYNIISPPDGKSWRHQIWFWKGSKHYYFYMTFYMCKNEQCHDKGLSDEICSGKAGEVDNCITQYVIGPHYDEVDMQDEIDMQLARLLESNRDDTTPISDGEQPPCTLTVVRYCKFDSSGRKQLFAEIRKCCVTGEPNELPLDDDGNRCKLLLGEVGPFRSVREAMEYVNGWISYVIDNFDIQADKITVRYWADILDKKVFDWNATIFACGDNVSCCNFVLPLKPSVVINNYKARWTRIKDGLQSAGSGMNISGVDLNIINNVGADKGDDIEELANYAMSGIGPFAVGNDIGTATLLAYRSARRVQKTIDAFFISTFSAGLGDLLSMLNTQSGIALSPGDVSTGGLQQQAAGSQGGGGQDQQQTDKVSGLRKLSESLTRNYYDNKRFILTHCYSDEDGSTVVRSILITGFDLETTCNNIKDAKDLLKQHLPTLCFKDASVVYVGPGTDQDGIAGPFDSINDARDWFSKRKDKIHGLLVKRYPFLVPKQSKPVQVIACASVSGTRYYYSRVFVCNTKSCLSSSGSDVLDIVRHGQCPSNIAEDVSLLGPFPTKQHALNAFYEILSTKTSEYCFVSSVVLICNEYRHDYIAEAQKYIAFEALSYPFTRLLARDKDVRGNWYIKFTTCCYGLSVIDAGNLASGINVFLRGDIPPSGVELFRISDSGDVQRLPVGGSTSSGSGSLGLLVPPPNNKCAKSGTILAIIGFFDTASDASIGAISYISNNRERLLLDMAKNEYVDYYTYLLREQDVQSLSDELRQRLIDMGYTFDGGGCEELCGCKKSLYIAVIYKCAGFKTSIISNDARVRTSALQSEQSGVQVSQSGSQVGQQGERTNTDNTDSIDREFEERILESIGGEKISLMFDSDRCLFSKMVNAQRLYGNERDLMRKHYIVKYIGSVGPVKSEDIPTDEDSLRQFIWKRIEESNLVVNKEALLKFADGDLGSIFEIFNEEWNKGKYRFPQKIEWDTGIWVSFPGEHVKKMLIPEGELKSQQNQQSQQQQSQLSVNKRTLKSHNIARFGIPVILSGLKESPLYDLFLKVGVGGNGMVYDTSVLDEFMLYVLGTRQDVVSTIDKVIYNKMFNNISASSPQSSLNCYPSGRDETKTEKQTVSVSTGVQYCCDTSFSTPVSDASPNIYIIDSYGDSMSVMMLDGYDDSDSNGRYNRYSNLYKDVRNLSTSINVQQSFRNVCNMGTSIFLSSPVTHYSCFTYVDYSDLRQGYNYSYTNALAYRLYDRYSFINVHPGSQPKPIVISGTYRGVLSGRNTGFTSVSGTYQLQRTTHKLDLSCTCNGDAQFMFSSILVVPVTCFISSERVIGSDGTEVINIYMVMEIDLQSSLTQNNYDVSQFVHLHLDGMEIYRNTLSWTEERMIPISSGTANIPYSGTHQVRLFYPFFSAHVIIIDDNLMTRFKQALGRDDAIYLAALIAVELINGAGRLISDISYYWERIRIVGGLYTTNTTANTSPGTTGIQTYNEFQYDCKTVFGDDVFNQINGVITSGISNVKYVAIVFGTLDWLPLVSGHTYIYKQIIYHKFRNNNMTPTPSSLSGSNPAAYFGDLRKILSDFPRAINQNDMIVLSMSLIVKNNCYILPSLYDSNVPQSGSSGSPVNPISSDFCNSLLFTSNATIETKSGSNVIANTSYKRNVSIYTSVKQISQNPSSAIDKIMFLMGYVNITLNDLYSSISAPSFTLKQEPHAVSLSFMMASATDNIPTNNIAIPCQNDTKIVIPKITVKSGSQSSGFMGGDNTWSSGDSFTSSDISGGQFGDGNTGGPGVITPGS